MAGVYASMVATAATSSATADRRSAAEDAVAPAGHIASSDDLRAPRIGAADEDGDHAP